MLTRKDVTLRIKALHYHDSCDCDGVTVTRQPNNKFLVYDASNKCNKCSVGNGNMNLQVIHAQVVETVMVWLSARKFKQLMLPFAVIDKGYVRLFEYDLSKADTPLTSKRKQKPKQLKLAGFEAA